MITRAPRYLSVSFVNTPANTLRRLTLPYTRSRLLTSSKMLLSTPLCTTLPVMRPPPSGVSVMRALLSSLMSVSVMGIAVFGKRFTRGPRLRPSSVARWLAPRQSQSSASACQPPRSCRSNGELVCPWGP